MTAVQGVVELTAVERSRLHDAEAVVERGLKTFVEVGQALIEIRDNRLYRASHATFEDYCEQRWRLSRARAYQLVDAAAVSELISSTMVDKIHSAPVVPVSERQARPLTKLLPHPFEPEPVRREAEQVIRDVWDDAVKTAPRDSDGQPKVTARHVEETVARRTEPAPERKTNRQRPITDAMRDAAWDLTKVVTRIEKLVLDDRFPRNAEQVARVCRGDLFRAADLLTAVLDRIPTTNSKE